MLESIGAIDVDEADNGKIALDKIQNKAYDIIFMDKYMPEMDGFESIKSIREDKNNKSNRSKIIFISADNEDHTITKALQMGADMFIAKPYRLNMLISRIKSLREDMFVSNERV